MAVDIWIASKDVYDVAKALIAKYHTHLAVIEDEIAIVFREKASKSGGRVVLGKSKKAPNIISVLGSKSYKFVLELAADEWQSLNGKQQTALLDHLLCYCGGEEDEKTGGMKWLLRSPELSFFEDELSRHGNWRPSEKTEEEQTALDELIFNTEN